MSIMRSILCLTPSSLALYWAARISGVPDNTRFRRLYAVRTARLETRGVDTAGHACVVAAVGRALGVGGGAVRAAPHVHGTAVDAAGVHPARRVAVYRYGGPVAGRKDGGCMVCARQEEGAHADGGLFRDDLHPDAAAFRRTAGFPDGAFPARMGAAPYPACRVLGLVGGLAAWGQGCRAAYALIHAGACSRWPFSYSSPSALPDTACSS